MTKIFMLFFLLNVLIKNNNMNKWHVKWVTVSWAYGNLEIVMPNTLIKNMSYEQVSCELSYDFLGIWYDIGSQYCNKTYLQIKNCHGKVRMSPHDSKYCYMFSIIIITIM